MKDNSDAYKSGEVKITYDPSVIRSAKDRKKHIKHKLSQKEYEKETEDLMDGNTAYDKGYRSTNNKIKRLKLFKKGFDDGSFVSLSAAQSYMAKEVIKGVSYNTCKLYAKELNLCCYDDKANVWLKGIKPKYAQ